MTGESSPAPESKPRRMPADSSEKNSASPGTRQDIHALLAQISWPGVDSLDRSPENILPRQGFIGTCLMSIRCQQRDLSGCYMVTNR